MHEMSVAQSLLQTVRRKAAAEKAVAVKKIAVSLGRFSGVEERLLIDAFNILTKVSRYNFQPVFPSGNLPDPENHQKDAPFVDTGDAALVISIAPFVIHCRVCKADHERDEINLVCPDCGGVLTEVVSGQEIFLTGLEMTKKPPSP